MQEKNLEFLGYPGYSIFSDGYVMNVTTEEIFAGNITKEGYMRITLSNSGESKKFLVHRLVGLAFIPPVEGKPEIDHINQIKNDNRLENLRWENRYGQQHNTGTRKDNQLGHKHIRKQENSYRVTIIRNYIRVFAKCFDTLDEAIQARDNFLSATD